MTTKLLAIALAAGLMIGTGVSGFAQSPTSEKTPGAQMQDKGAVKGSPGASGYAPGHLKKRPPLSATAGGVMAIVNAADKRIWFWPLADKLSQPWDGRYWTRNGQNSAVARFGGDANNP